jgi:hypothetical protein
MGYPAVGPKFERRSREVWPLVPTGRAARGTRPPGSTAPKPRWPSLAEVGVPGSDLAARLAERVRAVVLGEADVGAPLLDLRPLLRKGGFKLAVERLSAAEGRMEAFLAPGERNRFEIVVDPEPRGGWRPCHDGLREDIHRHRLRFRIGHEVGHSFFFDRLPGETPQRRATDSPEQEGFCDAFAVALLLPPSVVARVEPTPENIVDLQQRYDVSLQLAVRAFADVHSGHAFVLLYTDEEAPHVRPQWTAAAPDWVARWWAKDSVQRLGQRDATAVLVPRIGGRRSRLRALWLPQRRQALLVGRRATGRPRLARAAPVPA